MIGIQLIWRKVTSNLKKGTERKRVEAYEAKEQQNRVFRCKKRNASMLY